MPIPYPGGFVAYAIFNPASRSEWCRAYELARYTRHAPEKAGRRLENGSIGFRPDRIERLLSNTKNFLPTVSHKCQILLI